MRQRRTSTMGEQVIASQAHQSEARYPELFAPSSPAARAGCRRVVRGGTGLIVLYLPHNMLTPAEAEAIAEYRLHQYMLAGLYDEEIVARLGETADPAMAALADEDLHIVIGDSEDRLLCYVCVQTARPPTTELGPEDKWRVPRMHPTMRDSDRPFFPVESEYGLSIFGTHPGIGPLPLGRVRELTRLVRNQAIRSPSDSCVVLEAIVAIADVMCDPTIGLQAVIGCAAPEVRRLLHGLGIPTAYAPEAPILADNCNGGAPGGELLWSEDSHAPGRFWPMAISCADVQSERAYFDRLEEILSLPATQIAEVLPVARRRGPPRRSRYAAQMAAADGIFWTADPFNGGHRASDVL